MVVPSKSPWASPVVLVRKKDGSVCWCVDYRRVNELSVKDAYPLPRIDMCLDCLAESKLFSTPAKWLLAAQNGRAWPGEDSFHNKVWAVWIHRHAVWVGFRPQHLPKGNGAHFPRGPVADSGYIFGWLDHLQSHGLHWAFPTSGRGSDEVTWGWIETEAIKMWAPPAWSVVSGPHSWIKWGAN